MKSPQNKENKECCGECSSDPTGVDYSFKEHCIDETCKCHSPTVEEGKCKHDWRSQKTSEGYIVCDKCGAMEKITQVPPENEEWVGSLDETIRDNLVWYKENGSDHGDLVIAEEEINTKVKSLLLSTRKEEREKCKEDLRQGKICSNCGKDKIPDPLSDMCDDCFGTA